MKCTGVYRALRCAVGAAATLCCAEWASPVGAESAIGPTVGFAPTAQLALGVRDYDGMLRWYRDALGFEVRATGEVEALGGRRVARLARDDTELELVEAPPVRDPSGFADALGGSGYDRVDLVVASVDAAVTELELRGAATFVPAEPYETGVGGLGHRVGYALDPEGNVVALGEPPQPVPAAGPTD